MKLFSFIFTIVIISTLFCVVIWFFLYPIVDANALNSVKMSVPIPKSTNEWNTVDFDYVQTNIIFGNEETTVTKLPGMGISHGPARKAFSRVCPHLGCTLEFEQSSKKLKMKTGYDPDGSRCKAYITNVPNADSSSTNTAYIYCPCHQSVFKVSADDKGSMKTEVVQGPATESPKELDVEWVQEIDQPMEARPVGE